MDFMTDNLPRAFYGWELHNRVSYLDSPNPTAERAALVTLLHQAGALVPWHIGLDDQRIDGDLVLDCWLDRVRFVQAAFLPFRNFRAAQRC